MFKSFTVYIKTMQKTIQLQIQRKDFVPIGIGNKRILPYPVRTADGTYYDQYFPGIAQIEQAQKLHPEYKLFVPSSVDMGYLFEKVEPFWVGTGTVVLRKDKDGYADRRVKHQDGSRVKLPYTMTAEHGISWITEEDSMVIIDEGKLKEYKEIDVVRKPGWQYIQGFDKKDRGVPTKFGDKPKEEYNNARAWINPNLLIVPLPRGLWPVAPRERLYDSGLLWDPEYSHWGFPLGSEATADRKQLLNEQLSTLRQKVNTIPDISAKEIPTYIRDLDSEFERFSKDLLSE